MRHHVMLKMRFRFYLLTRIRTIQFYVRRVRKYLRKVRLESFWRQESDILPVKARQLLQSPVQLHKGKYLDFSSGAIVLETVVCPGVGKQTPPCNSSMRTTKKRRRRKDGRLATRIDTEPRDLDQQDLLF